MLWRKERDQLELFITGSLRQLVPDDHILARVDRVLDLSWLHDEVADLYCADHGRPGIDLEAAVRLMLAGFLLGLVHDRRLMREAQVNLAIRWFVGYGLHEALPDHSSLTRIRQRWGAERFRRIFQRTVKACVAAKIATGEVVHVDASLIRADVSWESLVERHVDQVDRANQTPDQDAEKQGRQTGKYKKVSLSDPDATMATTGVAMTTVTADAGSAYAKVYGALERRGIDALIPTKAEPIRSPVPLRRFRYDAKHDIVKCPRGKILRPGNPVAHGRFFYARKRDCDRCALASICLSKDRSSKGLVISHDHPALLRARRRRERWSAADQRLYQRHRWRSEGFHGEAKTWHGLARAVRRGLQNMRIQAYLTASAINLKRLAAALVTLWWALSRLDDMRTSRVGAQPV